MNDSDPYRPPKANLQPPESADRERGLFGLPAIALASAVGSMFAGMVLIGLNYAARKRRSAAWLVALLLAPVSTGVAVGALMLGSRAWHGASPVLWMGAWIAQPVLTTALAAWLHGAAIRQRVRAGRPMASSALALVIAVVLLPVLALFVAPIGLVLAGMMSRVLGG